MTDSKRVLGGVKLFRLVDGKPEWLDYILPEHLRTTTYAGRTADEWRALYKYRAGKLYHRKSRPGCRKGEEAGSLHKTLGIWRLSIGGYPISRAKVIFLVFNGWLPTEESGFQIDHINYDAQDDRIQNLRVRTRQEILRRHRAHNKRLNRQGRWRRFHERKFQQQRGFKTNERKKQQRFMAQKNKRR